MNKVKPTLKDIQRVIHSTDPGTVLVFDGVPSVCLKIGKTKCSIAVNKRIKGKSVKKVIGHLKRDNLKSLLQEANAYVDRLSSSPHPHLMDLTVGEFYAGVVVGESRENKTFGKYDKLYKRFVEPVLGSYPLSDVTVFHLSQVLRRLPASYSNSSKNHVRSVLMRVFSLAIKCNLISYNPCLAIAPKKLNNVVERYMSPEEVAAFCLAAGGQGECVFTYALLLSLNTGIRIGNVISIKKTMISSDGGFITLIDTKSGKHQLVPLSPNAKELVKRVEDLSTNEFLFSSPVKQESHISVPRKVFIRICEEAKIATHESTYEVAEGFSTEKLTIHCLRKTFGTMALKGTGSIDTVSKLLGHSDSKVTERYAFYQSDTLVAAVTSAGELINPSFQHSPH